MKWFSDLFFIRYIQGNGETRQRFVKRFGFDRCSDRSGGESLFYFKSITDAGFFSFNSTLCTSGKGAAVTVIWDFICDNTKLAHAP